jgi:serine/threonine protein kinase
MAVTGTRVLGGRYVLGEVLGTGGMATVWQARDEVLGREVAVKVLSPQYAADPGFLARFDREARHAAQLSHPRLVTVFDSGVDGQTPFIVMELVAGLTLRQVLDQAGMLSAGEAVRIAAAVCEALEVAHAAGLVHRDITPANIVLAGRQVKVLDFGIARVEGATGVTGTAGVLGTAAYLSPEQASGRPAGPQADLYSLGCVLFEMLTGAPPFAADSAVGLAYRHVHDDPGPPSARRPGLPARLDQITARLLAKDPAGRPASAAAARAGLLAALAPDATAVLTSLGGPVPRPAAAGGAATLSGRAVSRRPWPRWRARRGALANAASRPRPPRPHPRPRTRPPIRRTPSPRRTAQPSRPAGRPLGQHLPLPPRRRPRSSATCKPVNNGQVAQPARQDLFNHLQPLLFGPPGQNTQQVQQQYQQLVQAYDQHQSQGQITGPAAARLRHALQTLGTALGAL